MKTTLKGAKRWFWWHKWTSLVCTLFLLLLCITGLPLIFHHEIDEWSAEHLEIQENIVQDQKAPISEVVNNALTAYPNKVLRYVIWEEDHPEIVYVSLSDSIDAPPENFKILEMNALSGKQVSEFKQEGFMYIMLRLHTDMFAGIGGKLFLGLMGILFMISIISGVVLYGPIMKKFDFGMIRTEKSTRLKWLDTHNFLGIVALIWMSVVGFTGVINTTADIIIYIWEADQLPEVAAMHKGDSKLDYASLYSIDKAIGQAQENNSDKRLSILAMPGTAFSTKYHYNILMTGTSPVTSRLLTPVFVDAQNGETATLDAPWYVDTLLLSQPLHFGDYGGLPLKIIWAILDIFTIIILITGLYLWIKRFKSAKEMKVKLKNKTTKVLASNEKE